MKNKIKVIAAVVCIGTLMIFCIQIMFFGLTLKDDNGNVLIGRRPSKKDIRTDGPYFSLEGSGYKVVYVENKKNNVTITPVENIADKSWQCTVDSDAPEAFAFTIQDTLISEPAEYDSVVKILVFSDIEGNFYALKNILLSNGVMDSSYNWIYSKGHIVVLGDILDRGLNVTACLWLLYKLEKEALLQGGKVHLINGNHEEINYRGNITYVPRKYTGLANALNINYKEFFASNTIFGPWLKSKNSVIKIGNTLFCHGGISPELLHFNPTLSGINDACRAGFGKSKSQLLKYGKFQSFLFSSKGIMWYRGFFNEHDKYEKISQQDIERICSYFKVERIVVGHTIQDDIVNRYNGRVIGIDVIQPTYDDPGICRALLLKGEKLYRVYSNGTEHPLN